MNKSLDDLSPQKKREMLAKILKEKANKKNIKFPLSYGQQALWFIYELAPESVAYNLLYTAKIRKSIDYEILKKSFEFLTKRHPALKTKYITQEGKPLQQFCSDLPLSFQVIDASSWSDSEISEWINQEADRPFNLEIGDLFRVSLLTFSDGNKLPILVLTIHHIAAEFWSFEILVNELEIIYNALQENQNPSLKPLTGTYKDYVQREKKQLASREGEKQWQYWQQKLSGELPIMNLPTDRPRPPVQTYNGETYYFELDEELTHQLRELAKSEGVTLYVTVLAAFQVLLSRYSGQEDILIGSPLVNRNNSELENIIGYFVNPVVLRGNLSGNPSFKELLSRTRTIVLEALENSDFPFPLLVERLQPVRDPSRSPLFQVSLAWDRPRQNEQLEKENVNIEKLIVDPLTSEQRGSDFDTSLIVLETAKKLKGSWGYNTDLFDEDTINRMVSHFQVLLKGIVANPQEKVAKLPLLTEREEHKILVEWNDTAVDYPKNKCIHQLFEEQVKKKPDAVAVVYKEEELTYQELNQKANQLAHYLQKLGVKPDTLVGICIERSVEMLIGLLGILKAGGAYVPIDPNYPKERISYVIQDSNMEVLLTQQHLNNQLKEIKIPVISWEEEKENIFQNSVKNVPSLLNAKNLAYVIYTSGSTGKPKGVQIEHQSLMNFLKSMSKQPGLSQEDNLLAVTTISFDIAGLELYLPLSVGGKIILASQEIASDGKELADLLQTSSATIMQATPATWRMLIAAKWRGKSNLKILCGGEALPGSLVSELRDKTQEIWNVYGPTETTIWSSSYLVRQSSNGAESTESAQPIGHPIDNTQIYILDSNLQPVPIGVAGELHIGGDGLARGYLNRPELTTEKFIPNPFGEGKLYKTGDLCRYLPDGNIEYIGRIDHQVKIRGFRIELGEIEAQLSNHPEIRESVVIAREDEPGNKRLVAYIVPQTEEIKIPDLRDFLKKKLPDYMIPSAFVFLEKLPLTPNGKIDRKALPSPDWSNRDQEGFIAPQTPTQEMLASIWGEVLKINRIGINDNFFELGGHSLIAGKIMSRVRDDFQVEIPIPQLFESPTIGQFSQVIETQKSHSAKVSTPSIPSISAVSRQTRKIKRSNLE
ncbi:amino acid adenylation domain-containing protein [Crocosphaera sp.]|uniref:non-ribosomal peptide synthetase n=1 Tax=Crocosphaera sp. TaxID=2729996 RepID=UPI0026079261|nr:amino acid adenylation domain-containing protein [Crocosphaera sp.]MDJ0580941.1 amino acid adenylation domain-containing protein [Crocosphaera sp.]